MIPPKIWPILVLLLATNPALLLRAESPPSDPSQLVQAFLRWYLPTAFAEGAEAIFQQRMEEFMLPTLLQKWRSEFHTDVGLDHVPFVGQDYADAWAYNFIVGEAQIKGSRAVVPVIYRDPEWTMRLSLIVVREGNRWWIEGEEFESGGS